MQVRQYPFHVDPPLPPAVRDTLLVAGLLSRTWTSITHARDRRLRAERAQEEAASSTAIDTSAAFRSELAESGIGAGNFDHAMNTLMADETTVKELLGALAGNQVAAPDLGARVQELLTRVVAAPRTLGVTPAPTTAGGMPSPKAPRPTPSSAASRRSPGFRWEFTSEAAQARGDASQTTTGAPSPSTPATASPDTSAPSPGASTSSAVAEQTSAPSPPPASVPDKPLDVPPVTPSPASTATDGKVEVPTELGVVFALQALGQQSENLLERLKSLEAIVEAQAQQLEETERRLDVLLKRLEAREETTRRRAQIQAQTQHEVAALRERVARVEAHEAGALQLKDASIEAANEPPSTTDEIHSTSKRAAVEVRDQGGMGDEPVEQNEPPPALRTYANEATKNSDEPGTVGAEKRVFAVGPDGQAQRL